MKALGIFNIIFWSITAIAFYEPILGLILKFLLGVANVVQGLIMLGFLKKFTPEIKKHLYIYLGTVVIWLTFIISQELYDIIGASQGEANLLIFGSMIIGAYFLFINSFFLKDTPRKLNR